jgi:hypothetical protein
MPGAPSTPGTEVGGVSVAGRSPLGPLRPLLSTTSTYDSGDGKELFSSGRVEGYRTECGDRSSWSLLKGGPGFYGNVLIQINSVAP